MKMYHDKRGHINSERVILEIKMHKYYWKSIRNDVVPVQTHTPPTAARTDTPPSWTEGGWCPNWMVGLSSTERILSMNSIEYSLKIL